MRKLVNNVKRFWMNEDGAALVEYVVILGLILAVSAGTIATIGTDANSIFGSVANSMANIPGVTP
jgi:Flp pilus assembly pilin Flp